MYQPPHFREDRLEVMHDLIEAHPLGLLITADPSGPVADPVPFLIDRTSGEAGTLRAHLSRANPQARADRDGLPCLVVFQGAQAYITPSWYETKRETGKVVPTWNYVIVQARGTLRIRDDAAWLGRQIRDLTLRHEAPRAEPWAVDDAPEAFVAAQVRGIVGIEIEIASIDGKWKVSQNRPMADREGVAQGLAGEPDGEAMRTLVRRRGGLDQG